MPQRSYFKHSLPITTVGRVNKLVYKPYEYMPQHSCFEHSLPMLKGGRVNKLVYALRVYDLAFLL